MARRLPSAASRLTFLRSACVCAALAAATPLVAQTFVGTVPTQPFTLPSAPSAAPSGPTPVGVPEATGPVAPAVAAEPAPVISAVPVAPAAERPLRHLPATLAGFRLSGETAAIEWPVFLTPAQAGDRIRFRLGYLSAVSDAPEASELSVSFNDVKIGEIGLEAPGAVRTVDFDVPLQLAKPGFNALRLTARQRHRVDCSIDATYELWTQIDASRTGFTFSPAAETIDEVGQLPGVLPDADGALPIRVVVAGKMTPGQTRRVFRALQSVALATQTQKPAVDFGAPAAGHDGLNLVVGTKEELARQHLVEPFALGAGTVVRPATLARRTTVFVTGSSEGDLEAAIAGLAASRTAPADGTPSGLRARTVAGAIHVEGGERIRLGDLGLTSQEFSGRFFRVAFDIAMPADFLPADYAKATLELAGGYAPGLAPGAQVLVHINGKSVTSLRLPKSSGDVFKQNAIALPLGYWQPGINRIEVLAQLPVASDLACDTLAPSTTGQRFLFLDTTSLLIPPLARVGRLPELAATTGAGLPYALGADPKLFVPVPDRDTMAAAATLVARLAVAAQRPIDFDFVTKPPTPGSGATLVIAPARALDVALMRAVGLDPDGVRKAWEERAKVAVDPSVAPASVGELQQDKPAACRLPRWTEPSFAVGRLAAAAATEPKGPSGLDAVATQKADLFEKWNEDLSSRGSWLGHLDGFVSSALGWTLGTARHSAQWAAATISGGPAVEVLQPSTSLIVAQNALGGALQDVVTIVTAPTAATLRSSIDCLSEPQVWTKIGGRLATLDASTGEVAAVRPESVRYVVTSPLSFENVRLIVAGWFSNNPLVYVAMILFIAGCLGMSTTGIVRNLGRRQP